MMRVALVMMLGGVMAVEGALFPDDLPNTPVTALALTPNAAAAAHTINYETDRDWFSFLAIPYVTYTVTVQAVSVFDVAFEARLFGGNQVLHVTNSAWSRPHARWVWSHTGVPHAVRIGVGGLFQFTTGTYSVAVSGNVTDTNGDGIPDVWYQQYGLNPAVPNLAHLDLDQDGFTNWEEFWAGTNPTQAMSVLRITQVNEVGGQGRVVWPGAGLGVYEVLATTNLMASGGWLTVGMVTNAGLGPLTLDLVDSGATGRVHRAYRVRQQLDVP
ncbi:MAG TPA: hypothetical protein PKE55_09455 [Kiritimatiellia bacterium]|nr:hypothetical protein [Kiritimatiellia bacterium]